MDLGWRNERTLHENAFDDPAPSDQSAAKKSQSKWKSFFFLMKKKSVHCQENECGWAANEIAGWRGGVYQNEQRPIDSQRREEPIRSRWSRRPPATSKANRMRLVDRVGLGGGWVGEERSYSWRGGQKNNHHGNRSPWHKNQEGVATLFICTWRPPAIMSIKLPRAP